MLSPYAVGALLYTPANHPTVAESVIEEQFPIPYSLALCLEDAISDVAAEEAAFQAVETIRRIHDAAKTFYHPLLFIRVRSAAQMTWLMQQLDPEYLTGFIAPKFSTGNAAEYLDILCDYNAHAQKPFYFMPILESTDLVDLRTRHQILYALREMLIPAKPYILNLRVGGNDFCKQFGLRRRPDETIYQIGCVQSILSDIITCFSQEYVISGPVWEYFHDDTGAWQQGLRHELAQDKLSGFIGKTVIHPAQISVVNQSLCPAPEDIADAQALLALRGDETAFVAKSAAGSRMNELKTHERWAWKTLALAEQYGGSIPELPPCPIAKAAKREKNTKRAYLIVNPLQGKHIPAKPSAIRAVFDRLSAQVRAAIQPWEKTLVIGFAETATAIGAAIAAGITGKTWYLQTTRETLPDTEFLYFSETHSHAAEQRLACKNLSEILSQIDHLVFAEDEVTTGNTIRHLLDVLRGIGLRPQVQLHIASLLNGMQGEQGLNFLLEGIRLHYLCRTDNRAIAKQVEQFEYNGLSCEVNFTHRIQPKWVSVPSLKLSCSPRYISVAERFQQTGMDTAKTILQLLPENAENILVLGTEECMYPGLCAAHALEQQGINVKFHATTRSPICVSAEADYPLHSRNKLISLYENTRTTYIYNLQKYDVVFIVTDAVPQAKGLTSLFAALEAAGNQHIIVISGTGECP